MLMSALQVRLQGVGIVKNVVGASHKMVIGLSFVNKLTYSASMTEQKLFAGHAVRRIRRAQWPDPDRDGRGAGGFAQLPQPDRAQPACSLTAAILLRLAERFDFDARSLTCATPGGGVEVIGGGSPIRYSPIST